MPHSLFPSFFPLLVVLIVIIARRPATMLRRRGAVSLETAQPLVDLRRGDEARLRRLVQKGVVRETPDGLYYYDAAGQHALMRSRLPLMIALLVALFAISMALGLWLGRRAPAASRAAQVHAA